MAKAKSAPQGDADGMPARELKLTCMANLLSTTEERVYFKDLESRFLFISAGWIAAYAPGRSAEELTGKTDFDVFSHQHAADAFADEQEIIQTGKPIAGQVERETYTGRPDAWVSTTKMPLLDNAGRIIGTFGISRDVTAQVSAENTLARSDHAGRIGVSFVAPARSAGHLAGVFAPGITPTQWIQLIARLGEIPSPVVRSGPSPASIPDHPAPAGANAGASGGNG